MDGVESGRVAKVATLVVNKERDGAKKNRCRWGKKEFVDARRWRIDSRTYVGERTKSFDS